MSSHIKCDCVYLGILYAVLYYILIIYDIICLAVLNREEPNKKTKLRS